MNTLQQEAAQAITRHERLREILHALPQQPQRQDSTNDQLHDLQAVANRLGMYDAADVIRNILNQA